MVRLPRFSSTIVQALSAVRGLGASGSGFAEFLFPMLSEGQRASSAIEPYDRPESSTGPQAV